MSLRSVVPFQRPQIQEGGEIANQPINIGSLGIGTAIKKVVIDAPGAVVGDVVTISQKASGSLLPSKVGFLEPQVVQDGKIEVGVIGAGLSSILSLGTVNADIRWYRPNK